MHLKEIMAKLLGRGDSTNVEGCRTCVRLVTRNWWRLVILTLHFDGKGINEAVIFTDGMPRHIYEWIENGLEDNYLEHISLKV